MTVHYEVIIIGIGEDGITASGKCDEIVNPLDQENINVVLGSDMTHATHRLTHATQT